MKKIILSFAAFAALVSCTKENMPDNSQSAESFAITLQATAPGASDDTKTTLVDHSLVHWTNGDAIKVGFPVSSTLTSTVTDKSGVFASSFEDETSASAFFSISNWDWNYKYNSVTGYSTDPDAYTASGIAMYPSEANFTSERTGSRGVYYNTQINYTLPAEQIAIENSFAENLCFSTAEVIKADFINNEAKLSFKNECALIKIVLPEGVDDVVSVNVTSISGTPLVGKFYYSNTTGQPQFPITFTITDGVESVDLNAPENETLTAGATYYMVVCSGEHSSGLAFTFTNVEGKTCRKVVSNEVVLEKSKIDEFKFKSIVYAAEINYNDAKVGDYFYSDGSFSTELDGTKELVGVVFYKGDPTADDTTLKNYNNGEYAGCTHGLVVATSASQGQLMSTTFDSFSKWGTNNGFLSSNDYSWNGGLNENAQSMTGFNNTQALIGWDDATNYTSDAVNAIKSKNQNVILKGVSAWFLPSLPECDELYNNLEEFVNPSLTAARISEISGEYWTVSEENSGGYAALYNMSSGTYADKQATLSNKILPIFAF